MAIDEVDGQAWTRKHDNPSFPVVPSAPRTLYPKRLEDLIQICANRAPTERIHAAGSHWALSEAAMSDSVFVETHDPLSPEDARELLGSAPGVIIEDDPHAKIYPTPRNVAGKDEVYVGRIRKDASIDRGLALWLVSDNIRKGAALNAVQIAEEMHRRKLLKQKT